MAAQYSSGPLPPPQQFLAYNSAVPNAAERILKMAEEQADHRRKMEQLVIQADVKRADTGLIMGFIISILAIGCATYLIMNGHSTAGSLFFGATLVSLVGSFIYGTKSRKKERDAKVLKT